MNKWILLYLIPILTLYLIPFLMHVASEAEPKTQTSGSASGVQIREALGEASLLSALPDVVTKGIPGCRPRKDLVISQSCG